MPNYRGRHAELYDIFYAGKPYRAEAEMVSEMLIRYGVPAGGTLLEIACGTGAHAAVFEEKGWRVTALDSSPDMIRCAQDKAAQRNAVAAFFTADMRRLPDAPELAGTQFDAVVCLFDSIGYALTNEGVSATFTGVANYLKTGGIFCLEFWHAAPMLRSYSPVRVRRWKLPDAEIIRISETSLDVPNQTAEIAFDVIELGADGRYERFRETQKNRWFLVREMEMFLADAGFTAVSWYDGFSPDSPVSDDTWHVVAFVRKA